MSDPKKLGDDPLNTKEDKDLKHLEEEIEKEVSPLFTNVTGQQRQEIVNRLTSLMAVSVSTSFRGPLPPPEMLRQYSEVLPNGAQRVMEMAEKQSNHRMDMEKQEMQGDFSLSFRGQILGFLLVLFLGGISVVSLYFQQPWVAMGCLTTAIGTVVGAFVTNWLRNKSFPKPK